MLFKNREAAINYMKALKERLNKDELNSFWDGFSPQPLALYNNNEVFLINCSKPPENYICEDGIYIGSWDTRFCGLSITKLNDEILSIIDISQLGSVISNEKIFCCIVHELFHAYQLKRNYMRFGDDSILPKYPFTKENIAFRVAERESLMRAVFEDNNKTKYDFISKFISCREKRKALIGDFIEYELGHESMEGTATYVEFKAFIKDNSLPTKYASALYGKNLFGYPDNLNDFRKSCFSPGMYMCLLLDEFYPNWQDELINSNQYLYDFFCKKVKHEILEIKNIDYSYAEAFIEKTIDERRKEIAAFNNSEGYKIIFKGNLCFSGLDPMNITFVDNDILHKNYAKFIFNNTETLLKGPVLTNSSSDVWSTKEITIFSSTIPKIINGEIIIENVGKFKGSLEHKNNTYFLELS